MVEPTGCSERLRRSQSTSRQLCQRSTHRKSTNISANPYSRLADSIDPESINSETILSTDDTPFATLNKYIIKSIRESRIDGYFEAIKAIETITETLLNEIKGIETDLFQLFDTSGGFDSEERDKLLQRRHRLKDSLEGVVESWDHIISVSVAEGRSSQLHSYGYTAHKYYREIFTHPLPKVTFDPLRDFVSSVSVGLVRDDRMRTDTMPEDLPGKADIDERDRFFHEYLFVTTQSYALNPENTLFREYSPHASALQSLYDAIDIGMGSLQRDSDPAVALACDAVSLYGNLLHERESLREVGQQYDRPEQFTEFVYALTQSALLRAVCRNLDHTDPFSSVDRRVWLPGLIVLANEAAIVPEHENENTIELFQAFLELGVIGEYDSDTLGKALAIVDANRDWNNDDVGETPIEAALTNLISPNPLNDSPILSPWQGWADGIVMGPSGRISRYNEWIGNQRETVEAVRDVFESERELDDLPLLQDFLLQNFDIDGATHDLLDDIIGRPLGDRE